VEVTVTDGIILIQGDRELVARTSDAVKATVKQLSETLSNVTLKIPKKQHRLLVGDGADDIMKRAKCAVVVTSLEDSDEDVKVWGKQEDLPNGLMVTMQVRVQTPVFCSSFRFLISIRFTESQLPTHPNIHLPSPRYSRSRLRKQDELSQDAPRISLVY
jgi:hypothetical protein